MTEPKPRKPRHPPPKITVVVVPLRREREHAYQRALETLLKLGEEIPDNSTPPASPARGAVRPGDPNPGTTRE